MNTFMRTQINPYLKTLATLGNLEHDSLNLRNSNPISNQIK